MFIILVFCVISFHAWGTYFYAAEPLVMPNMASKNLSQKSCIAIVFWQPQNQVLLKIISCEIAHSVYFSMEKLLQNPRPCFIWSWQFNCAACNIHQITSWNRAFQRLLRKPPKPSTIQHLSLSPCCQQTHAQNNISKTNHGVHPANWTEKHLQSEGFPTLASVASEVEHFSKRNAKCKNYLKSRDLAENPGLEPRMWHFSHIQLAIKNLRSKGSLTGVYALCNNEFWWK